MVLGLGNGREKGRGSKYWVCSGGSEVSAELPKSTVLLDQNVYLLTGALLP